MVDKEAKEAKKAEAQDKKEAKQAAKRENKGGGKELHQGMVRLTITPPVDSEQFKRLIYWNRLTGKSAENSFLIYGGVEKQNRKYGRVFGWKQVDELLNMIP